MRSLLQGSALSLLCLSCQSALAASEPSSSGDISDSISADFKLVLIAIVPPIIVAIVSLVGSWLMARATKDGNRALADATVGAARLSAQTTEKGNRGMADATVEAARLSAQTTIQAVHEQIRAETAVRLRVSHEELSRQLAIRSSRVVGPIEHLMSRFQELCSLPTLRATGVDLSGAYPEFVTAYDEAHQRYHAPLDLFAAHMGTNARCTFVVYLFNCLGTLGRWRDDAVTIVPITHELVVSAMHQLRLLARVLATPDAPGEGWFSRVHLELIEATFDSVTPRLSWGDATTKIRANDQLEYAARNVSARFLDMFDQTQRLTFLRAKQVRGALIALYLLDFLQIVLPEYHSPFCGSRQRIWNTINDFAGWQSKTGHDVNWFLYTQGDPLLGTVPVAPGPEQGTVPPAPDSV